MDTQSDRVFNWARGIGVRSREWVHELVDLALGQPDQDLGEAAGFGADTGGPTC